MANRGALARLRKELRAFEAPPYIRAAPLENNIQEWRFVIQGPHDSPYEGGMYQGKLRFPDDYPFKPPSIFMLTPNGRFETDRRLCLSISDFHPETWIPTWSVATIINGVLSFMLEDTPTTGSVQTTLADKHRLREKSVAFNAGDKTFCALFPELVDGAPFTAKPGSAQAAAPAVEATTTSSPDAVAAQDAVAQHADLGQTRTDGLMDAAVDDAAAIAPGQGKNAAKNRKKREKAAAKKREVVGGATDGEPENEGGEGDDGAASVEHAETSNAGRARGASPGPLSNTDGAKGEPSVEIA